MDSLLALRDGVVGQWLFQLLGHALHVAGADHHQHAAIAAGPGVLRQAQHHVAVALADQRCVEGGRLGGELAEGGLQDVALLESFD